MAMGCVGTAGSFSNRCTPSSGSDPLTESLAMCSSKSSHVSWLAPRDSQWGKYNNLLGPVVVTRLEAEDKVEYIHTYIHTYLCLEPSDLLIHVIVLHPLHHLLEALQQQRQQHNHHKQQQQSHYNINHHKQQQQSQAIIDDPHSVHVHTLTEGSCNLFSFLHQLVYLCTYISCLLSCQALGVSQRP